MLHPLQQPHSAGSSTERDQLHSTPSGVSAGTAQAQVADIGLMGCPAKKDGKAVEGVRIFLGGTIGENAALASEFEKVPPHPLPPATCPATAVRSTCLLRCSQPNLHVHHVPAFLPVIAATGDIEIYLAWF